MPKQLNVNLAFTADTSQAKKQIQDLFNSLNNVQTKTPRVMDDTQLRKAAQAAQELQHHLSAALDVDTGKIDLSKFSASLTRSNKDLDTYRKELVAIGPEGQQAFLKVAQAIMNSEKSLTWAQKKANEFLVTLKNTARWQISSSILHGFQGALQSAFYYAQDLDKSLNNIQIVTGQNADQMAKFASEANAAAKALSTTTTTYTNAALIYYQQGLSDEEVKARTDVTVKLANVTGDSASKVSEQMTAIWNNFDDGTKSLEHYADVLTALGAATASSSNEIAGGMQQFAASASTVGLSYEYAASALATVVATTRQSENVVGNAFKTLFARLEGLNLGETLDDGTTLNKYSAALDKVGISIKDQYGNMKAMDDILDELGAKWGTLAKDQQVALAQTVGGVRQYTQLMALMNNWGEFQKNLSIANESNGSLQEQADIYAQSWDAAKKHVQASLEDIYSTLIDRKFFTDVTNFGADLLKAINGILKGLGGVPGILSMVMAYVTQLTAKNMPGYIQKINVGLQSVKTSITDMFKKEKTNINQQTEDSLKAYTQNYLNIEASKADVEVDAVYATQIKKLQQISQLKTDLANKSSTLSDAEKEAYSIEIQQLEAHYDLVTMKSQSVEKAEQETTQLKEQVKQAILKKQNLDAQKEGRSVSTSIDDEAEIDEIINKYQNLSANIEIVKKTQASMQQQVKDWAKDAPQSVDSVRSAIEKYINSLYNADVNLEELAKNSATFRDLQAVMNDTNATADQLTTAFARAFADKNTDAIRSIDAMLKQTKVSADDLASILYSKGVSSTLLTKLAEQAGISKEKIEEVKKSLEELEQKRKDIKNFNTHIDGISQDIMNIGSAFMNVSSLISTTQSAIATLSDKSTNNITKITTAISGVGSTLMNTISIMSQLQKLGITAAGPIGIAIAGLSIAVGIVTTAIEKENEALKANAEEKRKLHEQELDLLKTQQDSSKELANFTRELKKTSQASAEFTSYLEELIDVYDIQDGRLLLLQNNYDLLIEKIHNAQEAELARARSTAQDAIKADTAVLNNEFQSKRVWSMGAQLEDGTAQQDLVREIASYYGLSEDTFKIFKTAWNEHNEVGLGQIQVDQLDDVLAAIKEMKAAGIDFSDSYIADLEEIINSESYKTLQDDLANDKNLLLQQRLLSNSSISTMQEAADLFSKLSKEGNTYKEIMSEAPLYLGELANDYDLVRSAAFQANVPIEEMAKAYDSLPDEKKKFFGQIDFSKIDSVENLEKTIDELQNLASSQSITLVLTTAQQEVKDFNSSGTLQEKQAWIDSTSTFDWGETKAEQMQNKLQFLALTAEQQEAYIAEHTQNIYKESINGLNNLLDDGVDSFNKYANKTNEELAIIEQELINKVHLMDEQFTHSQGLSDDEIDRARVQLELAKYALEDFYNAKNNGNYAQEKYNEALAQSHQLQLEYVDGLSSMGEVIDAIEDGTITSADAANYAFEKFRSLIDVDIDESEWEELLGYLQANADQIEDVSDQLMQNDRAAKKVAEDILRFDKAIERVNDSYEDWFDTLENGVVEDQTKVMKELANTYADVLGLEDTDLFSEQFLSSTKNLQLMQEALNGDEQAYKDLQRAAAEDILIKYQIPTEQFQNDLDWVRSSVEELTGQDFDDIEVGASLNNDAFLQGLTDMVNAAGMTADEATAYLASMGVDAEVTEVNSEANETKEDVGFDSVWSPNIRHGSVPMYSGSGFNVSAKPLTTDYIAYDLAYQPQKVSETAKKQQKAFSLKVTSAHKSSGGGVKFKNASHGGGGGGSKGGGGGGGGSAPKHQTVKAQSHANIKPPEQSGERYHVINNQIEDLAKQYDRLSEAEERAFGKSKLALMDKQVEKLKEQHAAQRKLREEAQRYWKQDMEALRNAEKDTDGDGKVDTLGSAKYLGTDVDFDKNGTIKNYDELVAGADSRYNNFIAQYNAFIDSYNAAIDKYNNMSAEEQEAAKDQWAAEQEEWEKQKETWDERQKEEETYYDNFMGLIEQYEDTQDKVQEEFNKEIEAYHAVLDKLLEKTEYTVQLKVDVADDALRIIDFLQSTAYNSHWAAASNIAATGEKFGLTENKINANRQGLAGIFQNHFNTDHVFDNNNLDTQTNEFKEQMEALGYKTGEQIVQGLEAGDQTLMELLGNMENEFTENEVESWREKMDNMLSETENLWKAREDIFKFMDEYIESASKNLDNMADHMDHLANVASKYRDIMDIVGHNKGGFDTATLKAMTDAQQALRHEALRSAKARNDLAQHNLETAKQAKEDLINSGKATSRDIELWDEEIQKLQEKADSAREELLDDLHETLQGALDQFNETITLMAEDASKAMGGVAGSLEGLQTQMDQYEKTHSTFVPEYERMYQLNKLNAEAIKAIDETNNIKAKQELLKYQKQINEALESGREMSEWELQNLEKELALRQAALAVEEATSVKSQVRMSRDNEGNYSYIYTADESAVDDAQANYRDKLYEMQKANAEYINQLQRDITSLEQEYLSAIQEAANLYGVGSDEYYQALDRINEWYGKAVDDKYNQLSMVMEANIGLQEFDKNFHSKMTQDKMVSDQDYITHFDQTTMSQITGYKNIEDASGQWADAVQRFNTETEGSTNDVRNAVNQYAEDTKTAMSEGGIPTSVGESQTAWQDFAKYLIGGGEDEKGALQKLQEESNKLAGDTETLAQTYDTAINGEKGIIPQVEAWEEDYSPRIDNMINKNTTLAETLGDVIENLAGIKEQNPLEVDVSYNVPELKLPDPDPIVVDIQYNDPGWSAPNVSVDHSSSGGGGGGNAGGGDPSSTQTSTQTNNTPKTIWNSALQQLAKTDQAADVDNYIANREANRAKDAERAKQLTINMLKTKARAGDWAAKQELLETYGIRMATGGYTGSWGSNEGKLAILHEKELVLNKEDTANMLAAIGMIRQISSVIDLNAKSAGGAFSQLFAASVNTGAQELQQDVHITAEFPNATDKNEILAAFDNVINLASQYANRKTASIRDNTAVKF